jgi:hypothetical protein
MPNPSDVQSTIGDAHGLPPGLAELLRGETVEEMTTHAERLAAIAEPAAPAPGPGDGFDGGTRREDPRPSREYVRDFARRDPVGFNAAVDRGEIDLGSVS